MLSEKHDESHAEAVFGFLDGQTEKASEAARLVQECSKCREAVRNQVLLSMTLASGRPEPEGCLTPEQMGDLDARAIQESPHLRECGSCRLAYLFGLAEAADWQPAPARAVVVAPSWVERLAAWLHKSVFRPAVAVPVAAAAVAFVATWLLWPRSHDPFPFPVWNGPAEPVANIARFRDDSMGLALSGEGAKRQDRPWSFRIGFGAALVRDLDALGQENLARSVLSFLQGDPGLRMDPEIARALIRNGHDPCSLPGVADVGECRIGVLGYGLVRRSMNGETVELEAPVLRDILSLRARYDFKPQERPSGPDVPPAQIRLMLDLFRF